MSIVHHWFGNLFNRSNIVQKTRFYSFILIRMLQSRVTCVLISVRTSKQLHNMSSSSSFRTYNYKSNKSRNNRKPNKESKNPIKVYDHAGKVPRLIGNQQVFTMVQETANTQQLFQFASVDKFAAYEFKLSDLTDYTSWISVFDQYRIDEIQAIIRPLSTSVGLQIPTTNKPPLIFTVVDYDDSTVPTTIAELKQYTNCAISLYETVVVNIKPHMAIAAYSGSVFTSFANMQGQWIDAASASVPHYGIKMGIEGGDSGQVNLQVVDITMRYKVSFKNIR